MILRPISRLLILAIALLAFLNAPLAGAGEILSHVPESPQSTNHYLFYFHGGYVERNGSDEHYRYWEIMEALAARGFTVIGNVRTSVSTDRYVRSLAAQVRYLLGAGVPSWHIAVVGHGKGGYIALAASALLGHPKLRFGILAACGRKGAILRRPYRWFIEHDAANVQGQFLVMWDRSDKIAADCDEGLDVSRTPRTNLELQTGEGHELFYRPLDAWIDPLVAYLRSE